MNEPPTKHEQQTFSAKPFINAWNGVEKYRHEHNGKLPPMQNKPQLSAEMEARFDELKDTSYTIVARPQFAEKYDWEKFKHFLATALEEQRMGYIDKLEIMYYPNPYADKVKTAHNNVIDEVLAILNRKDNYMTDTHGFGEVGKCKCIFENNGKRVGLCLQCHKRELIARSDEREKVLSVVEGWLVDEDENKPAPFSRARDVFAEARNKLRAELVAKLSQLKEEG